VTDPIRARHVPHAELEHLGDGTGMLRETAIHQNPVLPPTSRTAPP
jgi:hypothetical protein